MNIQNRIAATMWTLATALALNAASPSLPVRGLHIMVPKPDEVELAIRFIRDALPKEGVNTLVIEFDYRDHASLGELFGAKDYQCRREYIREKIDWYRALIDELLRADLRPSPRARVLLQKRQLVRRCDHLSKLSAFPAIAV